MAFSVSATHLLDTALLQGLDASSLTAKHELGTRVRGKDGREYVYCQVPSTNVVCYAGYPAYWLSGSTYYVDEDISDCEETDGTDGPIGKSFAGVFCCAIAASHAVAKDGCFVWIQTKGYVPDASLSTSVVAQESLIGAANAYLDTYSTALQASSHIIAHALEDDVAGFGDIMLLGS